MPFDGTTYDDPRVDTLRRARARIAQRWVQGWNDGRFRNYWWQVWRRPEGFCAETALDNDENFDGALLVLLHAIGAPFGDELDLYAWNDESGRTQAEVLELYDRAIDSLT